MEMPIGYGGDLDTSGTLAGDTKRRKNKTPAGLPRAVRGEPAVKEKAPAQAGA